MFTPDHGARPRQRYGWLAALALLLAACGAPAAQNSAPAAQLSPPAATSPARPSAAASATAQPSAAASATAIPSAAPSASPTAAATAAAPSAATSSAAAEVTASAAGVAAAGFSGQRALETVRLLADTIGNRPAGSEAERRAADALAEQLRNLGWDTELQSFPIRSFEDRGSRLSVDTVTEQPIEVLALQNSAAGNISGPLVVAGLGRSEDLVGRDLNGAIALLERGQITFGDKVRNVADAGAIGAVIYNNENGSLRGLLQDPSSIPVAALDNSSGRQLAERAQQTELLATLLVDASITESTSNNVVATLPGTSDETIVLGAHYDSVADGPGANDNASGTATVLELARTLPAADLPATVRVVFFGAEEIGLVGSHFYVDSLGPQQREQIIAMLNFDMVGVGEQGMVGGSDELVQLAQAAAGEQGVQVGELGSDLDGRSDHAPFLDAGVPTLFFHRQNDPRYHTADDTAQYVRAAGIDVAGRLALAVMEAVGVTAVP